MPPRDIKDAALERAMVRMRGQKACVESLLAEGTECVFGNPGSTEVGFYDALQDYPQVRFYLGLHESVAMAMADGYARASGRPGVVNVHITPGLANSLGMLFNASCGGTPLVVTAGQQYTEMLLQEPLLAADLVAMTRQFTKWSVEVNRVADIPLAVRRAFKVATTPPTGPVFLSLPMDVLAAEGEFTVGPAQRLPARVRPDPEALSQAVELLVRAENPIMVVGDRVAQAEAVDEAVRLAETLGARVFTPPLWSEVSFPTTHPLYLGSLNIMDMSSIRQTLEAGDVIIAVGTDVLLAFLPSSFPLIPETARLIHMDTDIWEIGKNYPVAVGIIADPQIGMRDLREAVEKIMPGAARQRAQARVSAIGEEKRRMREEAEVSFRVGWDDVPISEGRLMVELRDCLPSGAVMIDMAVTTSLSLRRCFDFSEPKSFFGIRGGTLGWGMPGALGVKVALPDRPVVAVVGDGEAMFSIQALWTAAHYRIPVTFIVCNNSTYEIVRYNMLTYLHSLGETKRQSQFIGMGLSDPPLNFAQMARTFGLYGERVERPGDLKAVLKEALSLGGPAVVDVVMEGPVARRLKRSSR